MVALFFFILPILFIIGYFFYKERENILGWICGMLYYYLFVFSIVYNYREPKIEQTQATKTSRGTTAYEFSSPTKNCLIGNGYYCVIKTDSVKPDRNDICVNCGKTYNTHGGQSYKDEMEYNISALADYGFSGN